MGMPLMPLIGAAGLGLQAYGQYQQGRVAEAEGKSAQNLANYNAAVEERRSKEIESKTKLDLGRQAEEARRVKSSMKASVAKAGGIGSPVFDELSADQANELELDNLLIGYEGRKAAAQARSQAAFDVMQGKISREKGRNLRNAAYMKSGTTLLTGFANA